MKEWIFALCAFSAALPAGAATGAAKILGTAEGSPIRGTVSFEDARGGLKVSVRLQGVPPGEHGFHIHEFGNCEDSGKAAGSHYNPMKKPHGHALRDGLKRAHVGDFGNITAAADGTASADLLLPKVALSAGARTVAGRAVVLHEKADDFSQPAGNAGGRIACGAIVLIGP
ncbi:MAG: superoxide dismutase family protein [Elusimicrobia bacterium]|nr:superoxide dismutase family protein [Elusimicrobiota bacterium]